MAEASSQPSNTPKATKDKSCPYCHQAFTSSSLGRHLDLYIKERNPKAPDGVHNVEEIRKLRGNVTRRQAKGPLVRRNTSVSVGTPTATSKRSPGSEDAESLLKSPLSQLGRVQSWNMSWEATGALNDIAGSGEAGKRNDDGEPEGLRLGPQRAASRQALKQQLEARHRFQDAMDTSRAAELALRELIASWRAAKQQIDVNSTPFDFDPLSLDFPALTLQCLEPPPTLFSSTQHSTSTSWSITPPGPKQQEALRAYFSEEFQKWKASCAADATAASEDATHPPSVSSPKVDPKESIRKAERAAEILEKKVYEHIQSSFTVWMGLSQDQRGKLWVLELARGVGRRQKDVDKLKELQYGLKQENANLRLQLEQLSRSQLPREFRIAPPSTVFLEPKFVNHLQNEAAAHGKCGIGLNLSDRHADLNTIVSSAIDRWKSVIVSTRSAATGLQAQRPLLPADTVKPATAAATRDANNKGSGQATQSAPASQPPQAQSPKLQSPQQQPTKPPASIANTLVPPSYSTPAAVETATGQSSSVADPQSTAASTSGPTDDENENENDDNDDDDDEMSDEGAGVEEEAGDSDADAEIDPDADADADADAEMDEGHGYEMMNAHMAGGSQLSNTQIQHLQHQMGAGGRQWATMPAQDGAQLDVPRTRNAAQSPFTTNVGAMTRSVTHGHGSHGSMPMSRSMTNVGMVQNMGSQHHSHHNMMPGHGMQHPDLGMMHSGTGNEAMYID